MINTNQIGALFRFIRLIHDKKLRRAGRASEWQIRSGVIDDGVENWRLGTFPIGFFYPHFQPLLLSHFPFPVTLADFHRWV
jgi:hypothetical protein